MKYLIAALLAATLPYAASAATTKAVVVARVDGCDYFVVEDANRDFDLLEWYGGNDPDKLDLYAGDISSYGMRDLYDVTAKASTTIWVEDYALTAEDAMGQLAEKCA